MAGAVTGIIHAGSLGVSAIGRALATAHGTQAKHAIKQVDRLLSNDGIDLEQLFPEWIAYVLGERGEARIALDWTHFDRDGQATLAAYLLTQHGRATPLCWKTFALSELGDGGRTDSEDVLLLQLRAALPTGIAVLLVADRGFCDVGLYQLCEEWGWQYVIRFRSDIHVSHGGKTLPAREWLLATGRARLLKNAEVTHHRHTTNVVCVRAKGMKEAWFLASNLIDATASTIVERYAKRFTIEETFRDQKDPRFGLGMNHTRAKTPARRDRLLLLAALAQALLTLLGAAGERCGLDRSLKANTSTKRTMSLFRQGCFWYGALPNMPEPRAEKLLQAFGAIIREHRAIQLALGCL